MVANDFDETLTTIFARFLSFGTKHQRTGCFRFLSTTVLVIVTLSSRTFGESFVVNHLLKSSKKSKE
jgi:hypothetical protein